MSPFAKYLALFSLVLSATALTTPHISHNVYAHHRAVAAPVQHPVPVVDQAVDVPKVAHKKTRKRSLNKRCLPSSSSAALTSSTPSSASVPTSSAVSSAAVTSSAVVTSSAAATSAPVDVAPSPPVIASSSSSAAPPPPPPTTSSSVASATPTPTPAPTTSSTPPPPPPPSTSEAPTTTSSAAPAQTSSTTSSSTVPDDFYAGVNTGQGTYYETGLGACGITNNDSQFIVAVSYLLYDAYPGYNGENPNTNPVCGQQITATYGGASVTVTVTDRCTGCADTDLDFSPAAFEVLAPESVGRLYGMTWEWS